jgi:CHAD domain-containing protein
VASRRAREAVVLFRKWAPGKAARRARDAAREVTRALGTARNADVGAALLRGLGDGAWSRAAGALAARLERRARDSRRDVQATIGPKRVAALRTRLERFARALDEADGGGLDAIAPGAFARRVVAKRARRLFRRSESWADSADTEALHATRIASKKLRYAIEILEPLFGKGYRERHEMLKAIQDALGDYHDVALLLDEVARWERDGSPAMRAAGRGSWRALEARLLKERRASHERFLETMSGFTAVAFADYLLEPVEDRGAERGAAPRLAPAPVAPPAPRAAASADPGDPAP